MEWGHVVEHFDRNSATQFWGYPQKHTGNGMKSRGRACMEVHF